MNEVLNITNVRGYLDKETGTAYLNAEDVAMTINSDNADKIIALGHFRDIAWLVRQDIDFELADDGDTVLVKNGYGGRVLTRVNVRGDSILAMIKDIYRQAGQYLM